MTSLGIVALVLVIVMVLGGLYVLLRVMIMWSEAWAADLAEAEEDAEIRRAARDDQEKS